MTPLVLVLVLFAAVSLIGVGIALERRDRPAALSVIREIPVEAGRVSIWQRLIAQHPAPVLGVIETCFWTGIMITLLIHLLDPEDSAVAFVVWALTIGPHEIGHVVCMPFGWTLHIAGGSIWQVLVFVFPALYAFYVRRFIAGSLIFWVMAGHSVINLARYIDDARARELPLIMGLSKDHHDWWNLLRAWDMLEYDHTLALLTTLSGAILIVLAAGVGILSAWVLPRSGLGPTVRYTGRFWPAFRSRLYGGCQP